MSSLKESMPFTPPAPGELSMGLTAVLAEGNQAQTTGGKSKFRDNRLQCLKWFGPFSGSRSTEYFRSLIQKSSTNFYKSVELSITLVLVGVEAGHLSVFKHDIQNHTLILRLSYTNIGFETQCSILTHIHQAPLRILNLPP